MLTDNGVDAYTVKTDAFAVMQSQLVTAKGAAQLGGGRRQLEAQQDRRHKSPHRGDADGTEREPSCSDP